MQVSKEIVWRTPVKSDAEVRAIAAERAAKAQLTEAQAEAGWTKVGNFKVMDEVKITTIYPVLKSGKSCRVTSVKAMINVVDLRSGAEIQFSAYTHRRRVYFRDSRVAQPIPQREFITDVVRLLGSIGEVLVIEALHAVGANTPSTALSVLEARLAR